MLITPNTKIPLPPTPTVSKIYVSIHPMETYSYVNDTHWYDERTDVNDTQINAAMFLANSTNNNNQLHSYTPLWCEVRGIIKKEYHRAIKNINDPSDPNKCYFCGPKFIDDKQSRELVMQYNLKNPDPPTMNSKSK